MSSSVQNVVTRTTQFSTVEGETHFAGADAIFRAIVESTSDSDTVGSSRDALRAFVKSRCSPETFERLFRPAKVNLRKADEISLTRLGEQVFASAEEIARATTNGRTIRLRHLVAAFVVRRPGLDIVGYMDGSRDLRGGVDIRSFASELLAYVEREYGDDSEEKLQIWRELLGSGQDKEADVQNRNRQAQPGYSPDSGLPTADDDALRVSLDIKAFAELICLREASPPLSIGLFGNWGSGKTTFMNGLAAEIDALTQRTKEALAKSVAGNAEGAEPASPYVTDVVQIKFNAWHYADGDIWASLTAEFFDQLRAGGFSRAVDVRYANLVNEVAREARDASEIAAFADKELEALHSTIDRTKTELDDARERLESAERRVFAWSASQFIAESLKENKDKIDEAGKAVGIADLSEKPAAFRDELRGAMDNWGQVKLVAKAVANNRRRAIVFGVGIVLLAGFVAMLGAEGVTNLYLRGAGLAAGLVAMIGPWLAAYKKVQPIIAKSAEFAEALAKERDELDAKISAKQGELDALEKKAKTIQTTADAARDRAKRYITESDDAHRSLLRHFLFESGETRAYDKQLGLVSRARKSFERLNAILLRRQELREARERAQKLRTRPDPVVPCAPFEKHALLPLRTIQQCRTCGAIFEKNGETVPPPDNEKKGELPEIDRIVLYIDDLDRCRHQQVVRVLEAVHLLLAFDLFVVVVGVDARWMRNALAKYYEGEFGRGGSGTKARSGKAAAADNDDSHVATPDDYLEKIFQIPFWLQTLTHGEEDGTYQRLIDSLTTLDRAEEQKGETPTAEQPGGAAGDSGEDIGTASPEAEGRTGGVSPLGTPTGSGAPVTMQEEVKRVRLTKKEIVLLKQAGALAGGSPRTTKRFLNLYRLIRARCAGDSLAVFLGENGEPAEFPAVIFLLALAIGVGEQDARRLFSNLAKGSISSQGVANEAAVEFVKTARDSEEFALDLAVLKSVIPLVSRYSFKSLGPGGPGIPATKAEAGLS